MMGAVVTEAETRLAARRQDAARAKSAMESALADLQLANNNLMAMKLDDAIAAQRRVEEEALVFTKNVNTLYQRAAKWKAEQRRFRSSLEGLDTFEAWATSIEGDLQAIAGNLEYVCAVLEKEGADTHGPPGRPQ
ncbi:hypothetical protein P43SY_003239 [Pythium insidiosum]|uniref:Biogenesis of lysosome-related organelles complex 1 subunit 1 n=1 Tax=Pythium insidiosum TaxID=114742 RepID=A0AAD5LX87_PYTIN|nr:hypothetical protein P43SY_003239 [Pythium insidiosum]